MSGDQERFVLGIDGGGTRTRAVLVDADGTVRGVGVASGSNVHDVGAEAAGCQIALATAAAWRAASLTAAPLDAVGCALAGLVTDADRALARMAIDRASLLAPATRLHLDHDGAGAVAGAHLGRPGLVLIAGTGSACYGRAADGRTGRAGGWGWWLGDEGSGTWIGREALVATAMAHDGRGPVTSLAPRLLHALECRVPDELLHRVYVRGLDRAATSALAPLVLAEARAGDPVATSIVERAAEHLVDAVEACRETLDLDHPPLASTGGVASALRSHIDAALARRAVAVETIEGAVAPPFGAALLALERLGPVAPHVVRTLVGTSRTWNHALGGEPA